MTWTSVATGGPLSVSIEEPANSDAAPVPAVFYLENLAAPRVGTVPDEVLLREYREAGYLVVRLDYGRHERACVPWINRDLARLRDEIQNGSLLQDRRLDRSHIFIVPTGCRLARDVVFCRDGARTLAMDIVYPAEPKAPVGSVLEFSCDNENRMGNFSLSFCSDTILVGAAIEGFAAAMADHPVAAPYKGLDAMPDSARKIKAAPRTLRAQSDALGLNGRIVPVGFSRGSGMALMLVTTAGMREFEEFGEHVGGDSHVDGAIVMSGRFTYLDLLLDDHMLPRYVRAWGERETGLDAWRRHGALDYLTEATVPLFLTINRTEGPDALHQMEVLQRRLTELGSPFTYQPEEEGRGHKMPLDPEVLTGIYRYLNERLP